LSGGERRRLEITRALVISPAFMLLDEPFAGIDPIAVLDIQNIIRQLKERGIGVLITDHNVRETLGICERAYIMSEGAVLAQGAPAEILANEQVREVYLGREFRM
jgi:lipopolysaccharide export system ATP-binding protein